MLQHQKTHLPGDARRKDKLCVICNVTFYRTADLNRHIKIHSSKGDHVAPCGRKFSRADAIERHRRIYLDHLLTFFFVIIGKTKCPICTSMASNASAAAALDQDNGDFQQQMQQIAAAFPMASADPGIVLEDDDEDDMVEQQIGVGAGLQGVGEEV